MRSELLTSGFSWCCAQPHCTRRGAVAVTVLYPRPGQTSCLNHRDINSEGRPLASFRSHNRDRMLPQQLSDEPLLEKCRHVPLYVIVRSCCIPWCCFCLDHYSPFLSSRQISQTLCLHVRIYRQWCLFRGTDVGAFFRAEKGDSFQYT